MNIFSELFGIFRKAGLVQTIKKGDSLGKFSITAILLSIIGGILYGFSMGIGLGLDTAIKDGVKAGLISALVLLFSIPLFWVAFRLLGRKESFAQLASIPITLVSTTAMVLAATSPIVFLLSLLAGTRSEAVYIHIVFVNIALLTGLYLSGTLASNSFPDRQKLVVPSVIGFLMMGAILVVLVSFLGPFLSVYPSFSVGTDRLNDGLGINVAERIVQSLDASRKSELLTYRFQISNENGDLIQDYSVNRIGGDYLITVHLHAVPGSEFQQDRSVWVLDGKVFTDFDNGFVDEVTLDELSSYLGNSLPDSIFRMPVVFDDANWRADDSGGHYTTTGIAQNMDEFTVNLNSREGRITSMSLSGGDDSSSAQLRVSDIKTSELNREDFDASLKASMAAGSLIGVESRVNQSLLAANSAERVEYGFQTTNENGDLIQNYVIRRAGNDVHIEILIHAIPGETFLNDQNVWLFKGDYYHDFDQGFVNQTQEEELASILANSLPENVFSLPFEFQNAEWRGFDSGGNHIAIGETSLSSRANVKLDLGSDRISEIIIGSSEEGLHAEQRVQKIAYGAVNQSEIESSLNRATVVGSIDRFNASMQDYIQDEVYFVVQYPRSWNAGTWSRTDNNVEFTADCPDRGQCASLTVSVFDLAPDKGPNEYAEDLATSLSIQPEYRNSSSRTISIDDEDVGLVEYTFDQAVSGEIISSQHFEMIFEGKLNRFHLDFSALIGEFSSHENLFFEMAELFTFLK